ncbi:hypothetical protein B0H16DRAFT_1482619 [Mycena metata]|uniref:Uncharacterized protein n=1 Tax=Mycena metata TaxID=1033252 RepID=A0AAD7GT37_9AGAR|nr:hypothetical protein B0H16DRAFT_1482619 [Mycena metata]
MGTLSLATITFKDLASTNWSGLLTSWNPYLWNGNTVYPYDGNYQPAHGLRAYIQPNVIHKEVRPCLAKIIAAFGLFRTARSMSHRALLLDPNADHGTQPPRTRLDNLVLVYGSCAITGINYSTKAAKARNASNSKMYITRITVPSSLRNIIQFLLTYTLSRSTSGRNSSSFVDTLVPNSP